jgi:uncharacterized protein
MSNPVTSGGGPVTPTSGARVILTPLPGGALKVTAGFWARRQAVNRAVSIPSGWESLERAGTLDNFRATATATAAVASGGAAADQQRGPYFVDTDLYKWLEAVGWELGRDIGDAQDARMAALADDGISLIEAAQAPDGYLQTWFQLRAPSARFTDLPAAHELYCAGHLFQAAIALSRGAGDDRLLAVSRRFADYLHGVFGPGRLAGVPGHPEIEMALVELYRTTGDRAYLDLAAYFVDARGHRLLGDVHYGARYRQDDEPFRTARHARGHAVRAAYLACGALDLYAETGDESLLDGAVAQWEDMVARRMYLTGGVGTHHKDEAFGDPFELPPDRAYAETCAAIGVVMWSWRLLLATGECRYADLIERILFNAFSVGSSLRGDTYFYVNPLQIRAGRSDPEDGRGQAARSAWFAIACCPPNVMSTLSSLPHYFATATAAGVQLWQFAASRLSLQVAGGLLEADVETDYPLSGMVTLRVRAAPGDPCEIALRVPAWAEGSTGTLRGEAETAAPSRLVAGQLWRTTRVWRPGDTLELNLPLVARTIRPHPRIDAIRGCVAFERGPLVYCVEEADVGTADRLESLRVPADLALEPVTSRLHDEPVVLLAGTFDLAAAGVEDAFPYRTEPWATDPIGNAQVRLVPYSLWGNRRPGQAMRVWIPMSP